MNFRAKINDREELCRAIIFAGAAIFIVMMPLGKFFFSLSAVLICLGLIALAAVIGPRKLAISEFPLHWLFWALILWLGIKVVWSINPQDGLDAFKAALYKGFPFFIAGIEISRRRAYFLLLPLLFAVVAVYQGFDGVWQFYTGRDFINGDPLLDGRLTGSLSSYRVGNFIALVMLPALVLPWVLQIRPEGWKRWGIALLLSAPPLFLLIFSSTRSGYICLIVALCALFSLLRGFSWKIPGALFLVGIILMLLAPDRFGISELLQDGRLELWGFAVKIAKVYPLAGSGLYTFNSAFHSLGLVPVYNAATISHPHNIYLQLLCETGIIGLLIFSALLLGILIWGGVILRARLKSGADRPYWLTAAVFWATGVGYAVMAFTAHDLFRDWWFGLAWLQLGFVCGACTLEDKVTAAEAARGIKKALWKNFNPPARKIKNVDSLPKRFLWLGAFLLAASLYTIFLNPYFSSMPQPWPVLFFIISLLNIGAMCGLGMILPLWLYFAGALFIFNMVGLFSFIAAGYGVWPSVGLVCSLAEAAPSEVDEFVTLSRIGLIIGANAAILLFSYALRRALPRLRLWHLLVCILLIMGSYKFPAQIIQEEARQAIQWPLDFISPPVRDSVRYFIHERPKIAMLLRLKSPACLSAKRLSNDPLIVVYVMGESARADHFGIYGYARDTTPRLSKRKNLIVYKDVTSFAAWTRESTIGLLTNADMEHRTPTLGSFVDVYKANGFENYAYTNRLKPNWNDLSFELLTRSETKRIYVSGLDKNSIPVFEQYMNAGGKLQFHIFYTNGNHIDYNVRYPRSEAHYLPDDYENVPENIAPQARINAYDNTVIYVDGFIDDIIASLEKKNAVLLYTSDHGESLGEEGRLLHGNMDAPEQRFVPFIIWYSDEYARLNPRKVKSMLEKVNQPISHDYVFHTMLGLADFKTKARKRNLDLTLPPRVKVQAPPSLH